VVDVALERSEAEDPAGDEPGLSVVIPCLNEVRTIAGCVAAALEGIEGAGLSGEVIVADNGSTDGSVEAAEAAGARAVHAARRGYGAALQAGFLAARGRLLVMGDGDLSYDFRELPKLVEEQRRTGADIVLGDRLNGRIEPGAMPWTHRWIGNPLISFTLRRLFGVPLSDCYCGLRLLTRESFRRLRPNANTMEYALEMVVQGALVGMRFAQVPITLHVDGRDRAPHLRTVSDGYRSFRFLFQHAPIAIYGLVGGPAVLLGLALLGRAAWVEAHGGRALTTSAALGEALVLTGWLLGVLGIVARVFVAGFLGGRTDDPLQGLFRVARLETAVLGSAITLVVGLSLALGLGQLEALFQLGLTLSVVAIGTFMAAFVTSLVGRAIPGNEASLKPAPVPVPPPAPAPLPVFAGGPPAPSRAYDRWLAEALRGAWEGAGAVLDFGCSVGGVERAIAREVTVAGAGEEAGGARFEAVVSAGLLECVDDDVAMLRAMAERLVPDGRIGLLVAGGGDRLYGPADARSGRFRRYTAPRLRRRLGAAGLEVVSIRPLDVVGAVRWYLAGRRGRGPAAGARPPDRLVPLVRRAEALLGPPFGQWLVVVARRQDGADRSH
jgi:Glycosyl transferase family 2